MVSHKHKVIWIRIDKTAGSTLQTAFREAGMFCDEPICPGCKKFNNCHDRADKISKLPFWDDYFKMTFVRNPFDKILSGFCFVNQRPGLKSKFKTFKELIDHIYTQYKEGINLPIWYKNQVDWLKDNKGEIKMDFIGKFESLEYDYINLCNILGLKKIELKSINKTNHKSYREYYDDDMIKKFTEMFEPDLEYFGYSY